MKKLTQGKQVSFKYVVVCEWDNFRMVRNPISGCQHGEYYNTTTTRKEFSRWIDAANYKSDALYAYGAISAKLIKEELK